MKSRSTIVALVIALCGAVGWIALGPTSTGAVCPTTNPHCQKPPATTTSTSVPASTAPSSTQAPTTTSTVATTTTVPATTTTVPATTTSTVPATTTTVPATTTTVSSGGNTFTANFETPQDFFGRFNVDVGDYIDSQHHHTAYLIDCCPWIDTVRYTYGDHDETCGPPTSLRTLDNGDPDLSKYIYWCAPGGVGTGHVMTAFDTNAYAVVSFSPAQSFNNVQQVCWDINATEEGGGKWTNMIVIPESLYQQFAPRMDYVFAGFNADNAPGDFNIQQQDHPGTSVWGVRDFRGGQFFYIDDNILMATNNVIKTTTDKMMRFQHCVTRDSSSQSTLTVARPDGTTDSYTLPSAIPQGQVRVIFQDEMYDPPKRELYASNHVTWHLDNVRIKTG